MLIELALRGRLQLEGCGMRRKGLLARKVGHIFLLKYELCSIVLLKTIVKVNEKIIFGGKRAKSIPFILD